MTEDGGNTVAVPTGQAVSVDGKPRGFLAGLPVLIFLAIGSLFFYALQAGDPSKLPSALIGKPVPEVALAPIEGLVDGGKPVPGFTAADLRSGQVSVINVWASWCGPCVREHPQLVRLAERQDMKLIGINYKDDPTAARRFLGRYGNPFAAVGADRDGRASVEWGLTGVPETFVVDRNGRIAFKFIGELTPKTLQEALIPAIRRAGAPAAN